MDGQIDRQTQTGSGAGGVETRIPPLFLPKTSEGPAEIPLQLAMPPPGSFSASKTVFRIHILAGVEISRGLCFVHHGMRQCTAGFLPSHRLRGRTNSPQKNRSEMSSAKYLPLLARSIAPPPPEVMLVFPRSVFLARLLQPARSSRRFTRA